MHLPDYVKAQALNPEWDKAGRVHDWRNHVPEHIRLIWGTLSDELKLDLAAWADILADREQWD